MCKEEDRKDCKLRADIEFWIDTAGKVNTLWLNDVYSFNEFQTIRTELRERIFNYIKKREGKNDK
jgi:predicted RNA-binding Zn ribbon-like protein